MPNCKASRVTCNCFKQNKLRLWKHDHPSWSNSNVFHKQMKYLIKLSSPFKGFVDWTTEKPNLHDCQNYYRKKVSFVSLTDKFRKIIAGMFPVHISPAHAAWATVQVLVSAPRCKIHIPVVQAKRDISNSMSQIKANLCMQIVKNTSKIKLTSISSSMQQLLVFINLEQKQHVIWKTAVVKKSLDWQDWQYNFGKADQNFFDWDMNFTIFLWLNTALLINLEHSDMRPNTEKIFYQGLGHVHQTVPIVIHSLDHCLLLLACLIPAMKWKGSIIGESSMQM